MSLLDWDIVLFKPVIEEFLTYAAHYMGKPSLGDSASFQLKEACEHWRREIKQAMDFGKTVIVFLPPLEEVFVDTGQRSYSGTGRSQKTTVHVAGYNNYHAVPASLSPVTSTGSSMRLLPRGTEILSAYWSEFESVSQYHVFLTDPKVPACLTTKTGEKTVGALYRSKSSVGSLLLLPDINFYDTKFVRNKGGEQHWTPAAHEFAARMVSAIVAIDKASHATGEVTPEPAWATGPEFALGPESALRVQLLEAERQVELAQKHKEGLSEHLRAAGAARALLFEKGKPLENAIIDALRTLGFSATRFKESDSEFDVVFESEEGRLIGEAEGKDNKAVNIDKLRQLAMNIHEDLQREIVNAPAKPVLFGNGFRLQPPTERASPFSEKCHSAAATSSTAMVFTPDLFKVVQYLVSQNDAEYAKTCRQAILTAIGRVEFPPVPTCGQSEGETALQQVK